MPGAGLEYKASTLFAECNRVHLKNYAGEENMIFMATTKISAEKTAGEITTLLTRSGSVKYIQFEYDDGVIAGISFIIMMGETKIPFRLPVRVEPVYKVMYPNKRGRTPRTLKRVIQARRVAWRQILRWIQAQMAMVEIGMADIKEIFMPYLIVSNGVTLYESLEKKQFMIAYEKDT
jgi:hypothetical protein